MITEPGILQAADGSMSTNQVVEGFQLAADGTRIENKTQLGIYVKDKNEKKETKAANGAVVLNYDVTIPLVTIAGNAEITNKINGYFNDIKNKLEEKEPVMRRMRCSIIPWQASKTGPHMR